MQCRFGVERKCNANLSTTTLVSRVLPPQLGDKPDEQDQVVTRHAASWSRPEKKPAWSRFSLVGFTTVGRQKARLGVLDLIAIHDPINAIH
ncbi:hypothetical protein PG995_000097 [Apiospora arundinis]